MEKSERVEVQGGDMQVGVGQQIQIIMEGQIAKFIIPMLKNQTVNSNSYELLLCKMKGTSSDLPLIVSFLPSSRQETSSEPILPRFNRDGQFFTPAFLLSGDERFYRENISFQRLKFEERIQNAQEKSIIQNYHKVSPPSSYCQLCRDNYLDYFHHTHSPNHLALSASSPANTYIDELLGLFQQTPLKRKAIAKTKKRMIDKREERTADRECGSRGSRNKMLATCSKTSSQSTNVIEETVHLQNY